ncbi:MAG: LysR family transcriptional regulator [Rhodobacteraceae bacterium]|nr:LysR family transcriptional regulator [Paracoccaceae bacterium]
MDVKQLRYFIAIAEEGSLSAAAQRVNVAQPSLSQHVISLGRDLGVKLLERSPRGVSLIQSGEVLLSHAREIVTSLETAVESVRQSGAEPMGEVRRSCPKLSDDGQCPPSGPVGHLD